MMLFARLAIYLVVLFLIMIVFTGQHHDNARDILQDSVRKTGKWVMWTGVLVVVMELSYLIFIG